MSAPDATPSNADLLASLIVAGILIADFARMTADEPRETERAKNLAAIADYSDRMVDVTTEVASRLGCEEAAIEQATKALIHLRATISFGGQGHA